MKWVFSGKHIVHINPTADNKKKIAHALLYRPYKCKEIRKQ